MTSDREDARATRRERHAAIRAEVAQEEAEAAEAEAIETANTLDVPLHLRIDRQLDAQLRTWASTEHIPMSALVRRVLRESVGVHRTESPTTAEVEEIARRIVREELSHS